MDDHERKVSKFRRTSLDVRLLNRPLPYRFAITMTVLGLTAIAPLGRQVILGQEVSPESQVVDISAKVDFDKHIRPIFVEHCISCHGPEKKESRFRVDRRKSFLHGGDYGEPILVPGKPDASRLISILEKVDADLQMPPNSKKLSHEELKRVKTWIRQGANMPPDMDTKSQPVQLTSNHWSLQKLTTEQVPNAITNASKHAIDRFIGRRLEQQGLKFSNRAHRRTLIRRLYLVMLGVPPTPAEVDAFVNDQHVQSWEKLVDNVLNDSRYGERWAQHWLDIVRFGESDGFETNHERPNAWQYRDWVIKSFNDDKPYDEFIKQQIAGDAMGNPLGTGFLVAGPHDIVKSPDANLTLMQRQDELADIVNTTGTTFLGLTIGCARCHDHKFDPVTQTDFYSLQAVFAGVQHGERELPASPEMTANITRVEQQIRTIETRLLSFVKQSDREWTFVDESQPVKPLHSGFESLQPTEGIGTNPAGNLPGYRDDAGRPGGGPNLSGGSYTWWKNQPNKDFAVYRPKVRGRFRVWVSWGHGFPTHTQDARYRLDRDGDVETQNDQHEIAVVNQQRSAAAPADATSPLPKQPLWSGLRNLGVFEFLPTSAVILRAGQTGSAITADLVAFERVKNEMDVERSMVQKLVKPVSPTHNVEYFPAVRANAVRFEIKNTNQGEPCIDEIEIYCGENNVAIEKGVKLSSSGNYPNDPKHQLKHINDGISGNSNSWISNSAINSWVQIELATPAEIERIVWARDRSGKFNDRTAIEYDIKAQRSDGSWVTVATSAGRLPADYLLPNSVEFENRLRPVESLPVDKDRKQLASLLAEKQHWSQKQVAYTGTFSPQPPAIHRLHRGDPMAKREEVPPDTIRVIGSLNLDTTTPEQKRRIALADWIANNENPLTARVIVNRLWQYHFGVGLVSTPSDFGANGTPPSHPKLLDWLASDLIANGWSLKAIHRKILLSDTWQQSSTPNDFSLARDANSRLLWRFPPRRLEAEAIRDSMVTVSGSINPKSGGPGFSAFEVQMENVRHYFPKKKYVADDWRRMVYMTKIRQERESTFGVFDCPDGSQVMPSRSRSTTPLQALNLFNSEFVVQQANLFAKRLETNVDDEEKSAYNRIQRAYQLCYSRRASPRELAAANDFIQQHGLGQFCRALLNSNEFLFIP